MLQLFFQYRFLYFWTLLYSSLYMVPCTTVLFFNTNTTAGTLCSFIGIPALQRSSISRFIVLRDTSNLSASSGAVIFSSCSKIDNIPISLSIFIVSYTPYISYLIQHDSYMSCLLYLRKIFLYTIECALRKHSIVMNKKPTNIRFYSQCPKAQ